MRSLVDWALPQGDRSSLALLAAAWCVVAVAEGDESVALTLGAVGGDARQLVNDCLRDWMRQDRTWSRALPFVDPAQLRDGLLPPALEHELAQRLAQLKAYVETLDVSVLVRSWARGYTQN